MTRLTMARLSKKNKNTIVDTLLRRGEILEIEIRESISCFYRTYDISADALLKQKDAEPKFVYREFHSIEAQSDEWKKMYQDFLDLNEALLSFGGYEMGIHTIKQEMYDLNENALETLEYQIAKEINPELTLSDFKNTFGLDERENLQVSYREMLGERKKYRDPSF